MDILQIISTLGFPIAACVAMGIYIVTTTKDRHEEVTNFIKALDNNTAMIQKLCDQLEVIKQK